MLATLTRGSERQFNLNIPVVRWETGATILSTQGQECCSKRTDFLEESLSKSWGLATVTNTIIKGLVTTNKREWILKEQKLIACTKVF